MKKRRLLPILLAMAMVLTMMPMAVFADDGAVAKIGDEEYPTLQEAIAEVEDGETIEILRNVNDAIGIKVDSGKKFTIDFGNNTYTLTGPGAGSSGTETNGFQLLRDSDITFKNGTINIAEGANNIKRIIQNYANLTLENMTFYSANQVGGEDYCLSFNNGNITFKGNTSIINSTSDVIAFDVCKFSSYPSVNVTFAEDYTGTINGKILYDSPNTDTHSITFNGNGTFGNIEKTESSTDVNITVNSGNFASIVKAKGVNITAGEVAVVSKDGTERIIVGLSNINDAIADAEAGTVVRIVKASEDTEIVAPAGVTVINGTDIIINVNGEKIAGGKEITIVEPETENPVVPTNPEDEKKPSSSVPQTGDDFNMAIPFTVAGLALAAMAAAVATRKRHN